MGGEAVNPLWIALPGTIVACAVIVLLYRHRTDSILRQINLMLDKAISGDFEETAYDESRLSQVETKLWRFLSSGKLSRGSLEKDRDKIKALISDISHQTKTPVANIVMYSELLSEREDLPAGAMALASQIRPQAEKLSFLIQALIKASRLESGIIKVRPETSAVPELLDSAVMECLPKAEAKGVFLTMEDTFGITARFDPKWTAEALFNILDNAVKYTPPGGRVTVSAARYEMFVRIDVRDTGIGFPEHEHAKVFGRFWRSPSVSGTEGVGIGLYLAREIVSMQGGYIKAASVPGLGSTFSVFLPVLCHAAPARDGSALLTKL